VRAAVEENRSYACLDTIRVFDDYMIDRSTESPPYAELPPVRGNARVDCQPVE
jgi:hypothetical protein